MAFRVGQKVVCIRDGASHHTGYPNTIGMKKGEYYTIHNVRTNECGRPVVDLCEIDTPYGHDGFDPTRFRPVISTDTGMAILEQIRKDVTDKILRPIFEDEQA